MMKLTTQLQKIFGLLLVGALLVGCTGLTGSPTPTVEAPQADEAAPLVSATGIIAPSDWATLSMSTAGVIAEVLVKEGDPVEAGQVLVRLRGREELQAAITAAKFELSSARYALNDLNESAETAKVAALGQISLYAKQVRDAQYQLDNFTVPTNLGHLDPMQALDLMKEVLDKARTAWEPYKDKSQNDSTRKDLKEDLDDAQSDYNAAVRQVEYINTLAAAQANLDKARKDYAMWAKGPDPADVAVAQARLENANAALSAAQAALNDLELCAPFAGIISDLYVHTSEWVTPGVPILLVADLGHLRVETTDLNEIDAARVQVGSPVKVTFDALPDVVVQGVVKSIAPKSSQGSGVNYKAVVELSEMPEALRWGMTAFVDIEVK